MSRTKEQIIWKNQFVDHVRFDLNKFAEIIIREQSNIPEQFKTESFVEFLCFEEFADSIQCEMKIGYFRPETEEEKAVNNKLEEENEKRRYNRLKADFERLKAKFEKN